MSNEWGKGGGGGEQATCWSLHAAPFSCRESIELEIAAAVNEEEREGAGSLKGQDKD